MENWKKTLYDNIQAKKQAKQVEDNKKDIGTLKLIPPPVIVTPKAFDMAKRSSTSVAVISGTAVALTVDVEVIPGVDLSYSGGNNTRITSDKSGTFWVGGYITVKSPTNARLQHAVEIKVNGLTVGFNRTSSYIRNSGASWDWWVLEITNTPIVLAADDYVEFFVKTVSTSVYTGTTVTGSTIEGDKTEVWVVRADFG